MTRIFLPTMIAVFLVAGCGEDTDQQELDRLEPSPLPVTAVAAVTDTIFQVVAATGRISSARVQALTAQLQGEVVQAPECVGAPVEKGEVVFGIASEESASRLSAANSAYRNALVLYEFECSNHRGELTDEVKEMLRRTTGLADARVALESARSQYRNSVITAGFDGVVSEVSVREGMIVYPGTRLGSVMDPENMQVEIYFDERELADCAPGMPAFVEVPSLDDSTLKGTVASVSPVIDPAIRAGRVVVKLSRVPGIRPGATARVEVVTEIHSDCLVIPVEAVLIRDDRDVVFVIRDGKTDWRYVTLGPRGRGLVAVKDGLEPGELVITSGHYSLAHDAPVVVVD